ncbi:MAG: trigger factor [Sedimentisphaerales bacterium]|nr:trigger factor [Sedimentisphaerales bacterium]
MAETEKSQPEQEPGESESPLQEPIESESTLQDPAEAASVDTDQQNEQPEDEKLQCTVTLEDCGPWKKRICVDIQRDQIDKELDKQYAGLRLTALVPGFRKGRAPRRLIEKRYGDDISSQAKLRLLAQAFEQIEKEQDFEILSEPDLDPEAIELPDEGDFHFEYEVEVKPQFELPELEGIRIEKPLFEVTEERIDEALENLLRRQGRIEELHEGAAQEGDMLIADMMMRADGVEEPVQDELRLFTNSSKINGVPIEPKKEDHWLAGVAVGDEATCKGIVPAEFAKSEYRGKEAEFTLRIKQLRRLVPAVLNQEFLQRAGLQDESELRRRIEEDMETQADREIRNQMAQQVYRYLAENVDFELPEGIASQHADRALQRRYFELLQQGVPQEQITQNLEQLRTSSTLESQQQLKMTFILEKVSEHLGIEVGPNEVNAVVAQLAAQYGRRPERMRDELQREGRLEQITQHLRDDRAIDKILEMAEVVDAPLPADKAGAESAAKADKVAKSAKTDKAGAEAAVKADKTEKPAKTAAKSPAEADAPAAAESKAGKKKSEAKGPAKKTPRKSVKRKPPASEE